VLPQPPDVGGDSICMVYARSSRAAAEAINGTIRIETEELRRELAETRTRASVVEQRVPCVLMGVENVLIGRDGILDRLLLACGWIVRIFRRGQAPKFHQAGHQEQSRLDRREV
jgi:hypothetical protein